MAKATWCELYVSGNEERVFVGKDGRGALCRSPHRSGWMTLPALVAETGLTTAEVEAILTRNVAMGLVLRHGVGYGYWELVAPDRTGLDSPRRPDHRPDPVNKFVNEICQ